MSRPPASLLAAVLLVVPGLGLAAGGNLLPNSGFEEGERGWTLWRQDAGTSSGGVVEATPRQGRRCFQVDNRGTGGANLHSDPIPAQGNADYTLSAYVRTRGARDVRLAVWALGPTGETLAYELPYSAAVPGDQPAWARVKSIVRTPPQCTALKAHLIGNGGTVWWDAVKLEAGRDAEPYRAGPSFGPPLKNLVSNSGFEEGTGGWDLWHQFPGVSSGGVEEGVGRGGGRAFHVVNPGSGGANLHSEPQGCQPSTTYTISVQVRVKNGVRVSLGGWGLDGSGKTVSYAFDGALDLPAEVPAYRRFSKTFRTSADCVLLKAHLICNGGEVWWDDCQIERSDQATDYEPGARLDALAPRRGPERVRYTQAIIREARLRDVLAQTERLVAYAGAEEQRLEPPRATLARIDVALGARYLVPDYESVDYAALDGLFGRAEGELTAVWRGLQRDPQGLFTVWRPKLEGDLSKTRLAQEFLIFPCFTSDLVLREESPWEVLQPFGFRVVSGWWGLGYTAKGELETGFIDTVVRRCVAHGYRFDMAVDGASAAEALRDRLGEAVFLHNAQGQWSPQGNCHSTTDIWNPEVQRAAADFLQKAAAWGATRPGVLSYELENEPSLTIEAAEHGYDYKFLGLGGYGPAAERAWREWLQAKYVTVAALNARWRTAFRSFEEAQPPADVSPPTPVDGKTPLNAGPEYDFMTFRAESHAAWFRLCLSAMHAGDPKKPVISQFYSPPVESREAGVDLRVMAEEAPWDFLGTHDWPGEGPATPSLYATSMNRQAARPHWEDEFIWSQWEKKGTPEPVMRAALERNLWRQIAWGKRGISLFNFESEWAHGSPWNWNNSMLNLEADREVPRYSTGVIPTIERKANLLKDALYATTLAARDIALLRPTAATLVSAPDHRPRDEGTRVADILLQQHFLPLMIPEEHILTGRADLSRFRLLVAPWAVNVPEALQTRLLAWIRQGGVVLATGPFGLFDEYGQPSGTLMGAVLGERSWRYDKEKKTWGLGEADSARLLQAGCGRGKLYVLPEALSVSNRAEELLAVVRDVIPMPFVRTDLPKVEIVPRERADGRQYLFVVNLDATAPQAGEILLRGKPERVVDLTCEAQPTVPVRQEPAVAHIPVNVHPGGAVFLSLGRVRPPEATSGK